MKTLLAAIAITAMAGSASAADLPAYTKAPAQYPVAAANWSGFYLGLHGGYGWSDFGPDVNLSTLGFSDPSGSGWVFGGQAGYNWQPYQSVVVGLEIDYSAADIKDSQNSSLVRAPNSLTLSTKVDALGSVRGKVGYLLVPNVLIYGIGGLGWAHDTATVTLTDPRFLNGAISASASNNEFGWVAGIGAQWAVIPQVLLGLEYLHYEFGQTGHSFQPIGTVNSDLSVDVVRGTLNYKF